mgnify:CR=1 FL=1
MSSNIKAVTLQNFKDLSNEVRIELLSITLLFGVNSAGKSSVLQASVVQFDIQLERTS